MSRFENMIHALKKRLAALGLPGKKKENGHAGMGRPRQPLFVSPSASARQGRGGLIMRVRAWWLRFFRRREATSVPGAGTIRLKKILLRTCLLFCLAGLAFALSGPLKKAVSGVKVCRIQEITITGCRKTTPALIRELAGIRYQDSLLTLDPRRIEAILKAHPWIAAVEVKREWPDAVVVALHEFAPEALIVQETSGGRQFFYLDRSGAVFAPVEPGQDLDYPVITGLDTRKDVEELSAMLGEVLAFLKLVRQNNPNLPVQNLSEVHVDLEKGLTVYLVDHPFPIYFGMGEVRTKYSRLKRVLEVLYKDTEQGLSIADVAYIRMDYLENKVLVAHSGSG